MMAQDLYNLEFSCESFVNFIKKNSNTRPPFGTPQTKVFFSEVCDPTQASATRDGFLVGL